MRHHFHSRLVLLLGTLLATTFLTACGGGFGFGGLLGPLLDTFNPNAGAPTPPDGGPDDDDGGNLGGGDGGPLDPCDENQNRKFVTISMRNQAPTDFIHYFFIAIAFIDDEDSPVPDPAVCPDDIDLYTSFGYEMRGEGIQQIGGFCFPGPLLVYFHESGQFRDASGTLRSAIGPASGSQPTFDRFFTSAGQRIPVPNIILFHNPGVGDGADLKISQSISACDGTEVVIVGDPLCRQDAFYYVTQDDLLTGSTALGNGSGRRVGTEIQGSGCQCAVGNINWQQLAPSGVTGASAECFEFLRGGRIEYVFIRDDRTPPIPQLLWRVTDGSGGLAHDFDARANLP